MHESLARERPAAYTTALKMLQIMTEKGLVRRDERDRTHVYQARLTEEQTQRQLVRDLLDRAFGGSSSKLVLQALSARRASPEELGEIRKLIESRRDGKEAHGEGTGEHDDEIETLLQQPAAQAIGWALLQFVWQGALIGGLTALALAALRRSAADVRYVVAHDRAVADADAAGRHRRAVVARGRARARRIRAAPSPPAIPELTPAPRRGRHAAERHSHTVDRRPMRRAIAGGPAAFDAARLERWLPVLVLVWLLRRRGAHAAAAERLAVGAADEVARRVAGRRRAGSTSRRACRAGCTSPATSGCSSRRSSTCRR